MRTLFDGPDVTAADAVRLEGQLGRVFELMRDGKWRTLNEIKNACGGSDASVSARLRDCRKAKFGGHTVRRCRKEPGSGIWFYRLIPRVPGPRSAPTNAVATGLTSRNNAADEVHHSGARGVSND